MARKSFSGPPEAPPPLAPDIQGLPYFKNWKAGVANSLWSTPLEQKLTAGKDAQQNIETLWLGQKQPEVFLRIVQHTQETFPVVQSHIRIRLRAQQVRCQNGQASEGCG